jgi:hypothetical protein
MTDIYNTKVKVVDLQHPTIVSASLSVEEEPCVLALLHDGLVAMTTRSPVIYLLTMTDMVTVTSRITTEIRYLGVGGFSDSNLIHSCSNKDNNGVSRVDIISRNGAVVRTIIDSHRLTQVKCPWYLCVVDSHVLLSDFASNAVYKVDMRTGQHVDTHPS